MAQVLVNGVFMGAHLKKSSFEGKEKLSCMIDVYQPDSPAQDKMVSVKCDDAEMTSLMNENYKAMADQINLICTVSAFNKQAYFKLVREA